MVLIMTEAKYGEIPPRVNQTKEICIKRKLELGQACGPSPINPQTQLIKAL